MNAASQNPPRRFQSPAREASFGRRAVWATKNLARGLLWRGLERSRFDRVLAPLRRDQALIFYYRAVGGDELPLAPDNVLTPEKFRRQMELLGRFRRVVSLEDCLAHLDRHGKPPPNSAAITFDDGFACCREIAAPILHELGMPATFFVIPGFTESAEPKWDDFLRLVCDPFDKWIIRLPEDELRAEIARIRRAVDPERVADAERRLRAAMLTWKQMRELIDLGFSVQSHSLEHWYMSSQTEEVQAREIIESKRILEEKLGRKVRYFTVPFSYPGSLNETTVRLLQEHGYEGAFGGTRGYLNAASHRYAMPRIVVHDGISEERFRVALSGWQI